MPLFLLYILVALLSSLASISSVSRGSIFTETVKFTTLAISILCLIIMSVIVTILYSWIHIFGLILIYIVIAWVASFMWCSLFYKGKY
jgi:hypothetical protein